MEDKTLKKGFNIYLYYWTIPFFILLVILNYVSDFVTLGEFDIGLMISIVSFLFGFLITITFSMLLTKVSTLKESLAGETGRLVSLFLLSKQLGLKFHNVVKEKIDQYTILTLSDYTNYEVGRESIYSIYKNLNLMEIKSPIQERLSNSFLHHLGEFEILREKLEYLTNRRIEWPLKFTSYVLGFTLIVLLFLNRGDTFANGLFIVLSTIIIFIFLIIEDFDNLKIGDYTYNISNSDQIFDLIGNDRYYPSEILSRVKLTKGKRYRIGFYDKKTKKEVIEVLTYNPKFKSNVNIISSEHSNR